MEWLSLGSWISSCSHGHPGTNSKSASPLHWISKARVLDCETQQISDDDEAALYAKFHSKNSNKHRYVILTVELNPASIVEDTIVQRFATRIDSPDRLEEWKRGKFIRLMFVSRHRRTLGIVWTSPTNGVVNITPRHHMHPHVCSRLAFWQHSDVNSALPCWCNFGEDLKGYDGYFKMSDALSGINPTFWPFQTILPHVFSVFNTELFIPLPASTLGDTKWLFELIVMLEDYHYQHGGRTELRIAGDNTVLFLDLSIRSITSMNTYYKLLYSYGIQRAAQHEGKWVNSESISPLAQIPVSAVFRPVLSTPQPPQVPQILP